MKWIILTEESTGTPLYINMDNAFAVYSLGGYTRVLTSGNDNVDVQETPEQIMEKLRA